MNRQMTRQMRQQTMNKRSHVWGVAMLLTLASATAAQATCRIHNETKYNFTIESGNVSNQRVSSNSQTSIASGKIVGKSDDGKGIGGSCKDGDSIKIIEDKGVVILMPK